MIGSLELLRTHAAHIGSAAVVSGRHTAAESASSGTKTAKGTFENYLTEAVDYVNTKQIASSSNVEKLITDPDSVDIHDVTIAMAEASMSLNLAQTVIDRLISGWNEITTTR
ncbi:flagellar hook-basal body complex protein FliE [Treponema brennaborense]|uniref:Flagellar hook-basal body complex protein FliE n=1 Tax=Treponema brennaborense (strain DSM 12168 / CIP 105900 / DD5/3) TaxID=906968 RepID=F4LJK4_TREBD|nr:flagellar hook-basal body complex protein FliE [Treponema brennaborense]AEE16399.1 flagellar hook-basal body complex subunit FliE [Treponema brennaborense DSM 12168]